MSEATVTQPFIDALNLIDSPWTKNKPTQYQDIIDKIKSSNEKDSILYLTLIAQVPVCSLIATNKLAECLRCKIPDGLPRSFYEHFFEILGYVETIKPALYGTALIYCAQSIPISYIQMFVNFIMGKHVIHQSYLIFPILIARSPSLIDQFIERYRPKSNAEKALTSILMSVNTPTLDKNQFIKIANLFMRGEALVTTSFFAAFQFYVSRVYLPIDIQQPSELSAVQLFTKLNTVGQLGYEKIGLDLIKLTLYSHGLSPLAIYMYYQSLTFKEKKALYTSLIKEKGPIRSIIALQNWPGDLFDITTCALFCQFDIAHNIMTFLRAFPYLRHIYFEKEMMLKILEIASTDDNILEIIKQLLEPLKKFSSLAIAMELVLDLFMTKRVSRKEAILKYYPEHSKDILKCFYLIGTSAYMNSRKKISRFKSMLKLILPNIDLSLPFPEEIPADTDKDDLIQFFTFLQPDYSDISLEDVEDLLNSVPEPTTTEEVKIVDVPAQHIWDDFKFPVPAPEYSDYDSEDGCEEGDDYDDDDELGSFIVEDSPIKQRK